MQFKNLCYPLYTLWRVLRLTGRHLYKSMTAPFPSKQVIDPHLQQGEVITLQYPHETLSVPSRGRYQLDNAIEDCIVCDKCVRACPVDCIEIEAIPSPTLIGLTTHGMKKRIYAAKFDIDMAKCCFCGLCTTVCPTGCLTMTPTYDFSVFNVLEHKFSFATLTPEEIVEKKAAWSLYQTVQGSPATLK